MELSTMKEVWKGSLPHKTAGHTGCLTQGKGCKRERDVSLGDMVLLSLGLYLFVPSVLLSFIQMPLTSRIWLKAFASCQHCSVWYPWCPSPLVATSLRVRVLCHALCPCGLPILSPLCWSDASWGLCSASSPWAVYKVDPGVNCVKSKVFLS